VLLVVLKVYQVQSQIGTKQFQVYHRFSQVEEFHKQLTLSLEEAPYIQKWHTKKLDQPPKHRFTTSLNDSFISNRKGELQFYFNQLTHIPGITGVGCFLEFFNIELNNTKKNIAYCGAIKDGTTFAGFIANMSAGKAVEQLQQRISDSSDELMAFVYQGFWVNQLVSEKTIYLCLTMPGFNRKISFKILRTLADKNSGTNVTDSLLEVIIDSLTTR